MMNLSDAARVFDTVIFTDVNSTATFKGQILTFSDSVRSGSSTRRRILETDPETTIPDERTVTSNGQAYVLASNNDDLFNGESIRSKYPVLPVDTQFVIRTVGEILSASGGTTGVYVGPSKVRRELFEDQSDFASRYEMYFSSYYSAAVGAIFYGGGNYYRTRETSRVDDIGFGVAEAVHVEDPISQATVLTYGSTLDPVTDSYVETSTASVDTFTEHISVNFQHEALGFVPLEAGDRAISFLKSQVATVTPNDKVGDYLVKAVSDETTFWTVHGRKV